MMKDNMQEIINNIKVSPYYQNRNIILYYGDCLEIMKDIPDKSIDLILTDPPYGVRKKEKWDDLKYFENNLKVWLNECLRISEKILWFCADKMLPLILNNRYKEFSRLLIWNKPVGSQFAGAMNNNIWYSCESILYFGKNEGNNKKKKYYYSVFNYRTIQFIKYNHPTSKPKGLIKDLLKCYSEKYDIILDPFAGSGTTGIACMELNRKCILIEKEKKYCNIIIERCKQKEAELEKKFYIKEEDNLLFK